MRVLADENIPCVREGFAPFGDVTTVPGRKIARNMLADVDLLLVRTVTKVDRALLDGTPVKFVGSPTSGFDHVDREYLERAGLRFAYAPGSNANSVAEYVAAALLELEDKIGPLPGKTIGIVGAGHVGRRVREKSEALGMLPVLNDPPLAERTADPVYKSIDDALACDVVTFHVPLINDGPYPTHHLADESFLRAMNPGATLINTARGAVVDNAALNRVLADGHLAACVLDVWENEPNINLELLKRVDIGTPHIAGYSFDGKLNGVRQVYEQAAEYFGTAAPFPDEHTASSTNGAASPGVEGVRYAVRRAYDIRTDDDRLRRVLTMQEADRAAYFDALRRDYPARREFTVHLLKCGAAGGPDARRLVELGFRIDAD